MGEARNRRDDDETADRAEWAADLVADAEAICEAAGVAANKRFTPKDGPEKPEDAARRREYAWRLSILASIRSVGADVTTAIDEATDEAAAAREALDEIMAAPAAPASKKGSGLSLVKPKPPV